MVKDLFGSGSRVWVGVVVWQEMRAKRDEHRYICDGPLTGEALATDVHGYCLLKISTPSYTSDIFGKLHSILQALAP